MPGKMKSKAQKIGDRNVKKRGAERRRSGFCEQAATETEESEKPVSRSKGEESNTKQFGKD